MALIVRSRSHGPASGMDAKNSGAGLMRAGGRAYACRGLHTACVETATASKNFWMDAACTSVCGHAQTGWQRFCRQAWEGQARWIQAHARQSFGCVRVDAFWVHAGCMWLHAKACAGRVHGAYWGASMGMQVHAEGKKLMRAGGRKGFGRTLDTGARAWCMGAF
jgi:hypothetical protein